jgi:Gas vesicle synthesis protein GvpL/GvpF
MRGERRDGTRYYVYAIAERAPSRFKVGRQTFRTIEAAGAAAIVGVAAGAVTASEEALRAQHALVGRLARRFDALLPVRFGAIFTESDLRARLEADQEDLRDRLAHVRGRVQMTVRVHAASHRSSLPRHATGTEYLGARRESTRALERMAAQIRTAVARFVDDERVDPGRGDLLGSVYHLIKVTDVERYQTALADAARSLAPARLTITGPWPVFAFSGRRSRESQL